jgi:hypothetical protein
MPPALLQRQVALALAGAALCVSLADAAPVSMPSDPLLERPSPLFDLPSTAPDSGASDNPNEQTPQAMLDALKSGRWLRACHLATALLAGKVADLDALGVFGLCSAAGNDRAAADSALNRLRQVEHKPYYTPLVAGVQQLRARSLDAAERSFNVALQARAKDPLALYFSGEAQHANGRDAQAIASFKSVLQAWPQFAPAMTGIARLMSGPKATPAELKAALELADRAAAIEPMNRGYWRLVADLCSRTGQTQRANAITLQWLQPQAVPTAKK